MHVEGKLSLLIIGQAFLHRPEKTIFELACLLFVLVPIDGSVGQQRIITEESQVLLIRHTVEHPWILVKFIKREICKTRD
jgi:hypothetical protein